MASGGENFGDAGRVKTLLGQSEGGPQARPTGTHYDHVVAVINKTVRCAHPTTPKETRSMAKIPTTPRARWARVNNTSVTTFKPASCT